MPGPQRVICLVIDRLSAAYLGAMGNTWVHTPAFDSLAAESIVFTRAMIDSPVLEETYRSYWSGLPAWLGASSNSLAAQCRTWALPTLLVTDAEEIAEHSLASDFDEIIRLPTPSATHQASDWQDTQLARFFAASIDVLRGRAAGGLVWLHTSALARVWDSPQSLREQYADEDDPAPPTMVAPPSLMSDGAADPDQLLGLRHAYAGEVSVLDHCLAAFMDLFSEAPWRESVFCLASPRGYPLGEHGVVGDAADVLYGEFVRAALFVRLATRSGFGIRSDVLAQPADVFPTVCRWLASDCEPGDSLPFSGRSLTDLDEPITALRPLAAVRSPAGETALMTAAWFLRAASASQGPPPVDPPLGPGFPANERRLELFVKPDDYFEVNEISDRCSEVAGQFQTILEALDRTARDAAPFDMALPDELLQGTEASSP